VVRIVRNSPSALSSPSARCNRTTLPCAFRSRTSRTFNPSAQSSRIAPNSRIVRSNRSVLINPTVRISLLVLGTRVVPIAPSSRSVPHNQFVRSSRTVRYSLTILAYASKSRISHTFSPSVRSNRTVPTDRISRTVLTSPNAPSSRIVRSNQTVPISPLVLAIQVAPVVPISRSDPNSPNVPSSRTILAYASRSRTSRIVVPSK